MFDPYHNARQEGWMYLAKGDGPWYGSWEGLPGSVIVLNWHNNDADSLKFFADRGHPQFWRATTTPTRSGSRLGSRWPPGSKAFAA